MRKVTCVQNCKRILGPVSFSTFLFQLLGYWMFGSPWCDIHRYQESFETHSTLFPNISSALDVLLSTSSIMNLCLISLDRSTITSRQIESSSNTQIIYARQRERWWIVFVFSDCMTWDVIREFFNGIWPRRSETGSDSDKTNRNINMFHLTIIYHHDHLLTIHIKFHSHVTNKYSLHNQVLEHHSSPWLPQQSNTG